jgi:X-X-X-Leu-X-X-Gly heptad repeat protein
MKRSLYETKPNIYKRKTRRHGTKAKAIYRAARAATPIANALPRPAASWLAAPVKVAGVEVVTVPLVLAVDEAVGDLVVVAKTELTGAAELEAGAAELEAGAAELEAGATELAGATDEAGAGELAGATDEAGAAELDPPPAARAAQAAWAAVRVAMNIILVYVKMNS